jgi:Ca2+/H+ antiporter
MGSASHPGEGVGGRGFDDEEETELELEAGDRSPTRAETAKIQAKDPHLVEWDGPDDPENPQNLPVWRKWVITMILTSLTICVTFASSVFSEATVATAQEFGVSTEVTTLGTSLPLVVRDHGLIHPSCDADVFRVTLWAR